MTPAQVQVFHVRRTHWGVYTGVERFIPYLDPARFHVRIRGVQDSDDDLPERFPFRARRVRRLLRRGIQRRGQQWYKLSDLAAEASALAPWLAGRIDLLHYLDGEHTAQYLPGVPRAIRRRGAALATYHQPASVLPDVVVRGIVQRLDHITVVSTPQLQYFEPIVPADRLSVVHHGVDVDFFRPPQARPPCERLRCLSVGSYLRNWDLLAEIASRLRDRPEIELHVVSASAPPLERVGNVTVHRVIDDAAILALYHAADVLVLPLLDGTANNALLEAMATALPVLVTDSPAVREYAAADAAIFLPPDAARFVKGIEALAADAAAREAMGRAGRTRAESLSWPVLAAAYERVYERLV